MAKSKSHQNRGLKFESRVESKCQEYHEKGIALIHKVPTEFKITRTFGKVTGAYPVKQSNFIDFVGVYNGAVAIECKETKNKTSFPLSNIHDYQIDFMKQWNELGGRSYLMVNFETHKKTFLIDGDKFIEYIESIEDKSVKYGWFIDNSIELNQELDFIEFI